MSIGEQLHESTIVVLQELYEHGPTTTRFLQGLLPDITVGNAIESLRRHRYVESENMGGGHHVHTITPKGQRRLTGDSRGSGVIAGPRQQVSADTWKGMRWNVRETGKQAFDLPSRRGNDYVPHQPMFSLSSKVQDTKFR